MSMSDNSETRNSTLWLILILILAVAIIAIIILVRNNNADDLRNFTENSELYPSIGPENASDVVIEFSDFQCPFCALSSGLPNFTANYTNQYPDLINISRNLKEMAQDGEIRFIYVQMSFLGQESVYAAQAGLCANKQDKFWEMHDLIFSAHDGRENNGKYSKANLRNMAMNIDGLNTPEFNNCLDNDETFSDIREVSDESGKIVDSTPTYYVNGERVPTSWNAISNAIEETDYTNSRN